MYHPTQFDLFRIPPDDSLRLAGFDYSVPPALIVDRHQVEMPAEISEFEEVLINNIDVAKSESAFVSIAVNGEADSAQGRVFIKVAVDTVTPGTSLRLKCIITEDSVADSMGIYYPRVARAFVPDVQGKEFSIARFDTLYDTLSFSCAGFRPEQLSAVVTVEDANRDRVMQAAQLRRFALKED